MFNVTSSPKHDQSSVDEVRTPYPKFKHFSVKLKSEFLHGKSNVSTIVNEPSVIKLFQLSNGDFFGSMQTASMTAVFTVYYVILDGLKNLLQAMLY